MRSSRSFETLTVCASWAMNPLYGRGFWLCAGADFEQMRQIGHRMRGVGVSYGFDDVTSLGKLIEEGAKAGDKAALETHVAEYGEYLSNLRITYE